MRRTRVAALLAAGLLGLAGTGCGSEDSPASGASSSATFASADVTFASEMIPHHRQAVEIAELAPTHAESAQVKALAAQIKAAQAPEIETMTGWLRRWKKPVPDDMSGMDMSGSMPGMQSAESMDKLSQAQGAAFDQQFLSMMVAHHEGAIEMARVEQKSGQYAPAVALAREIEKAQTDEIATMKELLQG